MFLKRTTHIPCTPGSSLGYLASPRTIFHGCQIVHWDPLNMKQSCPQNIFGFGYVKMHVFHSAITPYMILKNGCRPTKSILSRVLLILEHLTWCQNKALTQAFLSIVRYVNHLICRTEQNRSSNLHIHKN